MYILGNFFFLTLFTKPISFFFVHPQNRNVQIQRAGVQAVGCRGRDLSTAGRGRSDPKLDRVLSGRHDGRSGERAHDGLPVRQRAGVLGRDGVRRAGRSRPAGASRGLHGRGRDQQPVNRWNEPVRRRPS